MKRPVRWILAAVAVVLLLPLLAAVVIILWVDPNQFRGQIETAARAKLGVPLKLQGDLHWRLWPLLSLDAGGGVIALEDDAGAPLLRWQQLQLGARWRALLSQELVVDRIALTGLELNLRRDSTGRANWGRVLDSMVVQNAAAAADDRRASQTLRVDSLSLRQARINYADARTAAHWHVDALDLTVAIERNPAAGQWQLTDLDLSATIAGAALPTAGVPVQLEAMLLKWESPSQSLILPNARLHVANATLELQQSEPLQLSSMTGAGTVRLKTASVRTLMQALGMELPATRDKKVFGALTLETTWKADSKRLNTPTIELQADDTRFRGMAVWPLDDSALAMFELAGDEIDTDRYLLPPESPREPFELPVETLRAIEVNGSVSFKTMHMYGVTVRDARFQLQSDQGRISARRRSADGEGPPL